MRNQIEEITKYLPRGWEEKAKEKKALVRGREIKTAAELLELNMLYLTSGGSFGVTSALLNLTTKVRMSKKAVYTRIQNSGEWLKWMAQEMCLQNEFSMPKPDWLERNVVAIDASDVALKGSVQSNYRLHCAFDIFACEYRTIEITDIRTGEKLTNHTINANDIVLADRVYGTIAGMEHVRENEGDFILRYRTKAFKIYDAQGKQINLLEELENLKELESTSIYGYYYSGGRKETVRIVAMKKDKDAINTAQRKMTRKMNKQRGSRPSDEALKLNEYIVLATSLDYTESQILELYRARWQIEKVFHTLKSMYDFGDVPSKKEETVMAWFYGKLFLAILSETILKRECFSPEEENLMRTLGIIKPVE